MMREFHGTELKSRVRKLWAIIAVVALSVSTFMSLAAVVSAEPAVGDYFEYDYNTRVDQGKDFYEGYSDTMRSELLYEITAVDGETVSVEATGTWTFEGSDGLYDSGIVDLTFNFSSATRHYIGPTDLEYEYADPSVWFWITPDLRKGQSIRILEDIFTVTDAEKTVWMGVVPYNVIELTTTGSYTRDDEYGVFSATYEDTYRFDRKSGYLISEEYVEHDVNSISSFRYTATIEVTSSSYSAPIDWLTFLMTYVAIPATIVMAVLLFFRWRRGPSRIKVNTLSGQTEVELKRIRRASELDSMTLGGSRYFTHFLKVFASRAIAEGDPVVVAITDRNMMGMAMLDKESHLGSVFAMDEIVARHLMRWIRMRDFFVEVDGREWNFPPAKKIDTFEILELRSPSPVAYDTAHVRPMNHRDVPAVVRIAQEVYKGPASKWVNSCFEGGDVAYVSEADGRVVGFGFATVVGSKARLHTLTMAPGFRASGLGSEIMAARLTVLSALGVDSVLVEISKHNDASMTVARNVGFSRIGETVYYSSRPTKVETVNQRRF